MDSFIVYTDDESACESAESGDAEESPCEESGDEYMPSDDDAVDASGSGGANARGGKFSTRRHSGMAPRVCDPHAHVDSDLR